MDINEVKYLIIFTINFRQKITRDWSGTCVVGPYLQPWKWTKCLECSVS